jgi:hypothetical protein
VSNASDHNPSSAPQPLGIAGAMTKMFIHSPLTPMFLVALLLIGLLGLVITPRQEDPQISVPMVDVMLRFPGASSEQVASLATDPMERMLSEIHGVEHVYSASERGGSITTVQFVVGQKMEPSLVKLYDKLASNTDKIPPGVSPPMIKPRGIDDVPTATFTLWSHDVDDSALRLVALEVLQRLKTVDETAASFIVGGRPEEIRVEVMPERLKGYGISIAQLAKTISAANDRPRSRRHPIPDWGVVGDDELLNTADQLTGLVATGHKLILHCGAGMGRTGILSTLVLVNLGVAYLEAATHVRAHRGGAGPDSQLQREQLERVAARIEATQQR